jgi:hypothetical protein
METWRTAYWKQARSDLAVFDAIDRYPLCQRLHYLQMATEKLAKAYLSPTDGGKPRRTHKAFVRFLQICRTDRRIRKACNMARDQFRAHVNSLLDTAGRIEDLAPVGEVERPNPEYPWQENGRSGPIIAPVDYPFLRHQLDQHTMVKLLGLVRRCMVTVNS